MVVVLPHWLASRYLKGTIMVNVNTLIIALVSKIQEHSAVVAKLAADGHNEEIHIEAAAQYDTGLITRAELSQKIQAYPIMKGNEFETLAKEAQYLISDIRRMRKILKGAL